LTGVVTQFGSSQGMQYDEATSRRLERMYTSPDVIAWRRAAVAALDLRPGERVVDIGSGPGFVALDVAEAVGPTGRVVGVDVSESMLSIATARAARTTVGWADFRAGEASSLPVGDGECDAAISTQVLEYVPDVPAALAEIHRVLKPGGRVAIVDTDFDSFVWHSSDPERMRRVMAAWDEHLADPHLPRQLAPLLRAAGFTVRRRETIPTFNPELESDSFSRGLIELIAGFVPGRQGVTAAEVAEWAADLHELGEKGRYFFSFNRYLFVASKA
jgi:ubiquinone/menaquinone biosynthesis C-methylase UbiE